MWRANAAYKRWVLAGSPVANPARTLARAALIYGSAMLVALGLALASLALASGK